MAVTHAGTTFNTTAGNKTVVATPAVGDLVVIVAGTTGSALASTALADNNSDGLGAYTRMDATSNRINVWIRNSAVGSATSTTFTMTASASDSGGGLTVYFVSGSSNFGSAARRSVGGTPQEAVSTAGVAATTPSIAFPNAPTGTNPTIGYIHDGTNGTANGSPPTNWTEDMDLGYNTPATGRETCHRDSGETNTTISWTATTPSAYHVGIIELDLGAAAGPTLRPPTAVVQTAVRRSSDW